MECKVCLEPFNAQQRRPKSLPCGHTMCQQCLQGLPQRQCPEDRKAFPAGALPDNYMVLQLLDNPPKSSAPRFWCSDCKKEATAACVEEHTVCAMKKAHGQRAQPHLDALRAGVASLDGLHAQLDAVEAEAAACRVAIEGKKAKLEAARRALEAAPGSEQAVFERAIAAAAATVAGGDVPRDAVRLVAALAEPASALSVALDAPGGAWRGRVLPREDAASRLLLCRLLCGGRLVRAPNDHGGVQGDAQGARGDQEVATGATMKGARRRQRGRQDREEVPQQDEPQQQQQHDRDVVVPTLAPRWQERKNGSSFEDMRDVKGTVQHARVVDLKRWKIGSDVTAHHQTLTLAKKGSDTCSSSTDMYGRVQPAPKYEKDTLVIRHTSSNSWNDIPYDFSQHKVLSCFDELGGPAGTFKETSHTHLSTRGTSSGPNMEARSKLLDDPQLYQVRELIGLRCDTSPAWAGLLMEKVALHLEVLQLLSPHAEHLRVAAAMPRLHSLHLDSVDAEMLRLALCVPSLRRLEVHCSWDAPLVVPGQQAGEGLRLPRAPALVWLRLGVYPLAAALAVARAHAATLRELELVAASDQQPYGCPDLGRELAACGLALLQKLVLRRDSPHEVCRHEKESCSMQKVQLWDMLHYRCKQNVEILCSVCDKAKMAK